jgi:hypothetical protein
MSPPHASTLTPHAAVRAGRSQISRKDMYAGVDRFTQGETRPALPTTHRLPLLAFTAKEVGWVLLCVYVCVWAGGMRARDPTNAAALYPTTGPSHHVRSASRWWRQSCARATIASSQWSV